MYSQARSQELKRSAKKVTGLVLVALLGFTVLFAPVANAATNGMISFDSNRNGNYEIYVMNANGSGLINLSSNSAGDQGPGWSPDGAKLAFSSGRDGNAEIYVMNADGTGQTNLSNNPASDSGSAWSPDGVKIAFNSNRDTNGSNLLQIYVMNADGTGVTRLTNSLEDDRSPSWSPDGSKIIFTRYQDGKNQIYLMNSDGSGQTNVSNSAANDFRPAWSPDGARIAFESSRDGNDQIYTMNADGTGQTNLSNNTADDKNPAWSPDGAKILFDSNRDGPCWPTGRCFFEVYSTNTDGTGQTNMSNNAADDENPAWQPLPHSYHWSWYDSVGGDNWVLMASPAQTAGKVFYNLSVAGGSLSLAGYENGGVAPGQVIAPKMDGLIGGPVTAGLSADAGGLLSQRTLWPKGGNSLEEVPATDEARLSDHYYWPWYDQASPGFTNWVLVSNPGNSTVYYQIKIAGEAVASGSLAHNEAATPTFPGIMAGPVEVQAWSDQIGGVTPARVIASQRVLSAGGRAFNEVPGIPAGELSDHYIWTWYDQQSQGAFDWVLISNPNPAPVDYTVKIKSEQVAAGTLAPAGAEGDRTERQFPGVMGGPIEVTATRSVIASQRSTWGPSFEEVPGYPYSSLATNYHWTWYDSESQGAKNWVLVANPNPDPVDYQVKIAGSTVAAGTLAPAGDPDSKDIATPVFDNVMGGPVEVTSAGGSILASQRVLWNGYFNEVPGTVLP